jgi:hypothetical protein
VRLRATAALVAGFLAGSVMVVMALALVVTVNQQQAGRGSGRTAPVAESQSALAAIPPQLMPLFSAVRCPASAYFAEARNGCLHVRRGVLGVDP